MYISYLCLCVAECWSLCAFVGAVEVPTLACLCIMWYICVCLCFTCMYISYLSLCLCVAECWSLPEHLRPRVCLHSWKLSRSPLRVVCALSVIYMYV